MPMPYLDGNVSFPVSGGAAAGISTGVLIAIIVGSVVGAVGLAGLTAAAVIGTVVAVKRYRRNRSGNNIYQNYAIEMEMVNEVRMPILHVKSASNMNLKSCLSFCRPRRTTNHSFLPQPLLPRKGPHGLRSARSSNRSPDVVLRSRQRCREQIHG